MDWSDSADDRPYFYRLRGQTLGPFPIQQMQQRAATGRVGRRTPVSRDGVQWSPAEDFPEVFTANSLPPQRGGAAGGGRTNGEAEVVWHYQATNGEQGQASSAIIHQMISDGRLNQSSFLWKEGQADWASAKDIPEFAVSAGGSPVGSGGQGESSTPPRSGNHVYCRECGTEINRLAVICPMCGVPANNEVRADAPSRRGRGSKKNKYVAAVLAFFLGGFGAHHFYLGNPGIGVLYLLFCWTLIPAIIAFIEFIVFLVMPENEFDSRYNS